MEEQISQIISALAQGDELALLLAVSLVEAVLQLDESAMQVAEAIMQRAEAGDLEAQVAMQTIQAVAEGMNGLAQALDLAQQATMARLGAKLDYINYLRGKCPYGYEMQMFRKGGAVCKKCVRKKEVGGEVEPLAKPSNAVDEFRCGRKMKKKAKKAACGKKINKARLGNNTSDWSSEIREAYKNSDIPYISSHEGTHASIGLPRLKKGRYPRPYTYTIFPDLNDYSFPYNLDANEYVNPDHRKALILSQLIQTPQKVLVPPSRYMPSAEDIWKFYLMHRKD